MDKTNLGVKPLGRAGVVSADELAKVAALKTYAKATRSAGPVNNQTAARHHRIAHLEYARAWDAIHKTNRAKTLSKLYASMGYAVE